MRPQGGFTLIELMITLVVLGVVAVALATIMYTAARSKVATTNLTESTQAARIATDMIAKDLRSAGYGADLDWVAKPQAPFAYVDSMQVLINENLQPRWPDTTGGGHLPPLAYGPTSDPKPFPLRATTWTPPIRYRGGAECVRWTLDVNNDGTVDAADIASANGVDAQRTPNPNDYELVRQVYGDSTGGVAGFNGGTTERIALIAKPGGGVPPMFTVYMKNATQPWDWSQGPIPVDSLNDIGRVVVQVTGFSAKPDYRGTYTQSRFKADVHSLRNVPDFGPPEYGVDGFVFNDLNHNRVKDAGEPGIPGVRVDLGMYSVQTQANGYFLAQAPAGTYTLKHSPLPAYGSAMSPDTFVVTVPPPTSRSFADTARAGGWVTSTVFNDANQNGIWDLGELPMKSVKVSMSFQGQVNYTDSSGTVTQFAGVGGYAVTCTAPDTFIVTTPNPVSGTMVNGGSATCQFGVAYAPMGTVTGTVFRDANRDGVMQGSESGLSGVWVGVSDDGGMTMKGYAYTNASGAYSISVPANDPPRTNPYQILVVPPPGFFPTGSTSIDNVWVQYNTTNSNNNFGMSTYQIITLSASRVLSLVSGDLIEKDWSSSPASAHKDADIVLGADANGVDQVSVWFNQWNSSPLFTTTSSTYYTRSAPNAVMAMALDSLDSQNPVARLDLVTGTKSAATGNFFVWINQGSSNNEGYFPTAYTSAYQTLDRGDVQAVLTGDIAGNATADQPDIIVGTKGPTAGQGSIEVWRNSNGVNPTFTRDDVYPPAGGMLPGALGEVTCMQLVDMDGDGVKDLVVGTTLGTYRGQVVFFKGNPVKSVTPHFTYISTIQLDNDAVTCLATVDINKDGNRDVVVGTQNGLASGHLAYLQNAAAGTMTYTLRRVVNAPGICTSLVTGDLGGLVSQDLALGWRENTSNYNGGVAIYYLDSRNLPSGYTDPSGGTVTNFTAAETINNFNFGANPTPAAPYLTDLAVGTKSSLTTGALVVFIR